MLAVAMASYERWYRAEKDNPLRQLMQSLWKGNKYLQNPTQMGLKLDELTLMSSVYFVKAFWSILEQDAVKVKKLYILSLFCLTGSSFFSILSSFPPTPLFFIPLPPPSLLQAAMNLISHSVDISQSLEVPAKNIVMEVRTVLLL